MRGSTTIHVGLAVLAVTLFCAGSTQIEAATIPVTNTADNGPGSLRAAIAGAANGDTIDATGVSGTITLTSGELLITNSVSVNGPGPTKLAINGNSPTTTNGVLIVSGGTTVNVSGLTITNGHRGSGGGGILNLLSTLTVSNCTVSGNSTESSGGGILSVGYFGSARLTVANCLISSNSSGAGGGINSDGEYGNATLIVIGSVISSNSATLAGGIKNQGSPSGNGETFITNSTISGNSAGDGGGLYNDGVVQGNATSTVVDSTISGNSGFRGGGIFNNDGDPRGKGTVTLINTTVSGNSGAANGGGIANGIFGAGATTLILISSTLSSNSAPRGNSVYNVNNSSNTVQIGNTILNAGGPATNIVSVAGTITSLGYNLSSDDGGGYLTNATDQLNTDPLLGPLQDNGGPVFTHTLLPGSPAIDQGKNLSGDATDARGFPRTVDDPAIPNAAGGDGTDIGAYEAFELRITIVQRLGNDLRLSFTSLFGKNYELQSRSDLSPGLWSSLPGTIPGNGGIAQATVTNAFGQPQQFYRIHQLP